MPLKTLVGMWCRKDSGMRRVVAIVVMVLCAMHTGAATAPAQERAGIEIEWTEGPKLPMPLGGHSAVVMDEGIVVAGGSNWPGGVKVWRDEIFVLEGGAKQWRQAAKLPMGMTLSAAVVRDGRLMLLGGWYESHTTGDSFVYANGTARRAAEMDLPAPRAQAGAVNIGGVIYVVGGMTDGAEFKTAVDTVDRFGRHAWAPLAPLPRKLALSSTIALGGKIYVFGGMGPVDGKPTDSDQTLRYDAARNRWETLAPLPAARRGAGAVVIEERYVLLIGGCRNDEREVPVMMDEVLAYDTTEDRFVRCTPLPFSGLCIAAVVKDGKVWAIGGEDLPRHRTDRVVLGSVKLP